MCGIVGVWMKENKGFLKKNEDCFYQMLYANALRGDDSTGVIGIERDASFHIAKEAMASAWSGPQIQHSQFGKAMWSYGRAMVGHNRKKTIGEVKDETAHPFVIDNTFALVHNGTLFNHKALHNTEVDSQALAMVIKEAFDKDDWKPALEEALGRVYGAYALAFYDQKREKAYLLRNHERPLSLIETDDAWYFCSEGLMGAWILTRNGYAQKDIKIVGVNEHELVTYDLVKGTISFDKLTPKKAPSSHIKGKGQTSCVKTERPGTSAFNIKSINSKQQFKQLKRKMVGSLLEFWCVDWVEANFPRTVAEGETNLLIFGDCTKIDFAHDIQGVVDIADIKGFDDDQLDNDIWLGQIEEMTWDATNKKVHFFVKDSFPINAKKEIHETPATVQ